MIGVVQPTIASVVLGLLGPTASVAFRVVSTVSGAVEPILAYGRYRLLAHGHKGEVAAFAAIFLTGMMIVLAAAFLGLGRLVFGPAWNDVGVVALLLACLWKGFTFLSTIPFAALRKAGATATVFWIRAASTLVYLAIGLAFLVAWRTNVAIFAAFLLAEMLTALLYHNVATKGAPDYDVRLRNAAHRTRAWLRPMHDSAGSDDDERP